MSLFDVLNLIGGLSLFLFGMHVMGAALEKRAAGQLKALLGKLTGSKLAGFLTGLGVTAVIQSSSATTVMVVGFVNSGLMTLKQAIHVIMGANVGTTVTAWLLSLAGLDGSSLHVFAAGCFECSVKLLCIGVEFAHLSGFLSAAKRVQRPVSYIMQLSPHVWCAGRGQRLPVCAVPRLHPSA